MEDFDWISDRPDNQHETHIGMFLRPDGKVAIALDVTGYAAPNYCEGVVTVHALVELQAQIGRLLGQMVERPDLHLAALKARAAS